MLCGVRNIDLLEDKKSIVKRRGRSNTKRLYLKKINKMWKEDMEKYGVDQIPISCRIEKNIRDIKIGKFGRLSRDDSGLESFSRDKMELSFEEEFEDDDEDTYNFFNSHRITTCIVGGNAKASEFAEPNKETAKEKDSSALSYYQNALDSKSIIKREAKLNTLDGTKTDLKYRYSEKSRNKHKLSIDKRELRKSENNIIIDTHTSVEHTKLSAPDMISNKNENKENEIRPRIKGKHLRNHSQKQKQKEKPKIMHKMITDKKPFELIEQESERETRCLIESK